MKSTTCFRKDGEPKAVYFTAIEAQGAAEYVSQEKEVIFSAYQCRKCSYWHICPVEMQTPNKPCSYCNGGDGKPKALYETYDGAKRRANIIYQERGIRLSVYECRYDNGFHLTKG